MTSSAVPWQLAPGEAHDAGVRLITFLPQPESWASADLNATIVLHRSGSIQRVHLGDYRPASVTRERIHAMAGSASHDILFVAAEASIFGIDLALGAPAWELPSPRMFGFIRGTPLALVGLPDGTAMASFTNGRVMRIDAAGNVLESISDEDAPQAMTPLASPGWFAGIDGQVISFWNGPYLNKHSRHRMTTHLYSIASDGVSSQLLMRIDRGFARYDHETGEFSHLFPVPPGLPVAACSMGGTIAYCEEAAVCLSNWTADRIHRVPTDSRPLTVTFLPGTETLMVGLASGAIRAITV